jgi:hypothetical protein
VNALMARCTASGERGMIDDNAGAGG